MGTSIDKLEIEVVASGEKAKKTLSGLEKTLGKLDRIAKSPSFEKLNKSLDKLSKVKFTNLKSLNNVNKTVKGVNDALSSVQKNISSSIGDVISDDSMEKTESAIKKVRDNLNSIPKKVGVNISSADTSQVTESTKTIADNLISSSKASDILKMKLDGVKEKLASLVSNPNYDKTAAASLISQAQKLQAQIAGVGASSNTTSGFVSRLTSRLHSASSAFRKTTKKASEWTAISDFFGGIANWVNTTILTPIIEFFTPFVEALCGFFGSIWSVASTIFVGIKDCVVTVFTAVYDVVDNIIRNIIDIISGIAVAVWSVVSKIAEIVKTIGEVVWAVVSYVAKIVWDNCLKPIADFVSKVVTNIIEKFTSITNAVKVKVIDPVVKFFKGMVDKVSGFFKNIAISASNALANTFKSVLNGAFTMVENLVNGFIKGLNGVVGIINKIPGVSIEKVQLLSIPRFANGGFPDGEDGLFMANHNEIVGKFSNGKTAVANNDQIVEGITGGVYVANQEQNGLLREQNKLLRQLVEKQSNGQIDVTTIVTALQRKNQRDGKIVVPLGI